MTTFNKFCRKCAAQGKHGNVNLISGGVISDIMNRTYYEQTYECDRCQEKTSNRLKIKYVEGEFR